MSNPEFARAVRCAEPERGPLAQSWLWPRLSGRRRSTKAVEIARGWLLEPAAGHTRGKLTASVDWPPVCKGQGPRRTLLQRLPGAAFIEVSAISAASSSSG